MITRRTLQDHERLARVIEQVLRSPTGHVRVAELARLNGFSRFHLTRIFQAATGESLEPFLRRVRLERAAFTLRSTKHSIGDISMQCGYTSPEAFSRAFRASFGMLPTVFRRTDLDWKLASPTDLHWNSDWVAEFEKPPFETVIVDRPATAVAVWRAVRNYGRLAESWEALERRFGPEIPSDVAFVTLYLDNMWTHPASNTMRADLGWVLAPGAPLPKGMRRRIIPAGRYVATVRAVDRTERNDAWSFISGTWPHVEPLRDLSFDEYPTWPLPFEEVKTRIFVTAP